MESTWESLSDRSERSSCFHQRRRATTTRRWWRSRKEWNSAQVFLRTETPASRRKQRLMGRYRRYPLFRFILGYWSDELCLLLRKPARAIKDRLERPPRALLPDRRCVPLALFTDITCDTSVSVIDLWPLVPRKLSVEDHLKEAKKMKHKADATVFIKPCVESAVRWVHTRSDRVSLSLSWIRWLKRCAIWRRHCHSRRARSPCRRSRRCPNPPTPCSRRRWTWSGEKPAKLTAISVTISKDHHIIALWSPRYEVCTL